MAEISFGGLATGLPTEDLVKGLMAIERRPLERLQAEKEYESLRLKAYGQFNDRLDGLRQSARELSITSGVRTTAARLSSTETISASSSGASPGSYEVSVAQLAQMQKTVTAGYDSASEAILGRGTFTIGDTLIAVTASNNSLEGLMNSINALSKETGVSATLINDGKESGNFHLVLTGKDAATSFSVSAALQNELGEEILFSADNLRTAQQAIAYVDGIEVVSNSNSLSGVIPGLTINLNKADEISVPGSGSTPPVFATSTTINVEPDSDALKEKLNSFVTSYNALMEWIVSGYEKTEPAASSESETKDDPDKSLAEYLRGDATINSIKSGLQSVLTSAVEGGGSLQILAEIGISTQKNGTLRIDNGKLDATLSSRFDEVVGLLAGSGENDGVMKKFNAYLVKVTSGSSGMYAEKRNRYDAATRRLDLQITQKEPQLAKIEERIRAQFNAMELLISSLNAQSDFLTQQMDMMANFYNKGRK